MLQPHVIVQAFDTPLDADPAPFPTKKRRVECEAVKGVDPHGTGLEPLCRIMCLD